MLTKLSIRNFKRFTRAEIELDQAVVLIGPNNTGKTTALQSLALWEISLRRWREKRGDGPVPPKRPGVTINRRDVFALPIPSANLLWRDLQTRSSKRAGKEPAGTENIKIEIIVEGVDKGVPWTCGLEFDYANEESFYCRPIAALGMDERAPLPPEASSYRIAYLPPMSGLVAREDKLEAGAVNVRIGEGRTADVLRNLCLLLHQSEGGPEKWHRIAEEIGRQFGAELGPPVLNTDRGEITLAYKERGVSMDISCAGRGLQQVLLLLAYLASHPGATLLLDEPDAHLEILRQRQIYNLLTATAEETGSQIIAASHSEVILHEAAAKHAVVAFVGQPHRVDRKAEPQVLKALADLGFDQYYQAESTGWVLYLEGSTDLDILSAFAEKLAHPAAAALARPFVHYLNSNRPQPARNHFHGLREAKPDLLAFALFDHIDDTLSNARGLTELMWTRREIESYFATQPVLLRWVAEYAEQELPLSGQNWAEILREEISGIEDALRRLGHPSPWSPECKVSDDFLAPLFRNFFARIGRPVHLRKTGFHFLIRHLHKNEIPSEVVAVLDKIHEIASHARSGLAS